MEILYKVADKTFTDKKEAEEFERKHKVALVQKANVYKGFYLPLAFRHYLAALHKLRAARANFKMKSFTSVSNLNEAFEAYLTRKRVLRERIAEYRNTKSLIK